MNESSLGCPLVSALYCVSTALLRGITHFPYFHSRNIFTNVIQFSVIHSYIHYYVLLNLIVTKSQRQSIKILYFEIPCTSSQSLTDHH